MILIVFKNITLFYFNKYIIVLYLKGKVKKEEIEVDSTPTSSYWRENLTPHCKNK